MNHVYRVLACRLRAVERPEAFTRCCNILPKREGHISFRFTSFGQGTFVSTAVASALNVLV